MQTRRAQPLLKPQPLECSLSPELGRGRQLWGWSVFHGMLSFYLSGSLPPPPKTKAKLSSEVKERNKVTFSLSALLQASFSTVGVR